METSQVFIECLRILFSWPVAVVVILILLKKEIPAIVADLSKRLKKVEVGGQTFEFGDDLEKQSKVAEVIENIQQDAPDLFRKSLDRAGIKETEYNDFRSNIRNKVLQVQQFLHDLGYDLGRSGIDGVAGQHTKDAVRKFQQEHGLLPDGAIGPQTLGMINYMWSKRKKP